MAVIPLESLPLGFRFRPTDEELINYYLKRKITGDIRSEREVIPEIDVCKCEPWDLPDKALIRSEDPEWFFFAPKDRKYPNGSRSNRATEKGYWKATGKDRIIRSKGPVRQATVVGMKKTLVFHKGRAPRGERTHWIMHEYRTTEPDYESGEQGGYVLYKLFRKTDERAPGTAEEAELSTVDEVDTSGFSPAPSRSSPGGAQQDGETLDEITAPVDHKSVLQDDHLNIPNSAAGKTVGTQRWLDDRADCKPAKHNVNDSNFAIGQPQNMEPPPDALLDQFSDPQYKKNEYLFGPAKQESHHLAGQSGNDNNLSDDANDIIDSFFAEPDAYYSPGESTWQDNSADVAVSDNVESTNQRVVNQDEAVWSDGMINIDELLMDVPDECLDLYCADAFNGSSLYENAVPLPYVGTDQDVHSVDSGADSLQDLFSTLEESSTQRNNLMPCNDTNGLDDPGLVIRPHQLDPLITHNVAPRSLHIGNQQNANFISSTQFNYMSANNDTFEGTGITRRPRIEYQLQSGRASGLSVNHGIAARRLCLQTRLDIGTMSCSPSGSVKRDGTELDEQVDEKSDEFSAEVAAAPSDASSVDKFDELSVKDDNDAPKTEDAIRLRKKITGPMGTESVEIKSFVSPKRAPKKLSVPHRFWFVMSAAVILCIGILSLCYSIGKAESVGVQSLLSNLTLL